LNVVDLPESFEGALARNRGVFGHLASAGSLSLEAFGKVFRPTTLGGETITFHFAENNIFENKR
jgi:hypothetical protein